MKERSFLAVDLGAESGRAIVGTITDLKLSLEETHRFVNQPVKMSSGLHWDISALWREIKQGISVSADRFHLESLALDTWGVDFALLGKDGILLGNPYHYRDVRTNGMLETAFSLVRRQEIFAQTGIQFMQLNTLYQLLAMVKANDPQLTAAQTFLTIPDLFNYWLSGTMSCEFTNATTTQCLNPLTRSWAFPILEALDIPTRIFPSICEPGTTVGLLIPSIADETGAGSIPIVAPACHDTGSAVAAVPAHNHEFAWLSSGTWSIMGAEISTPCLSEKAMKYNFTNEGGVFGTWRFSKNIMGLWIVQECRRSWAAMGEDLSYDTITRMASEAQPFLAVIDPDAEMFFHPGEMIEKVRSFCSDSGQATPQTKGEVIRVILESLAFKYRLTLERIEELIGKHLDPIHIIGGGSRNRLLNQFTADATNRKVVAGPVEATAIGNILMQAIAVGQLGSLEEARAMVRNSFELETYQPGNRAGWDEAYQKLLNLI